MSSIPKPGSIADWKPLVVCPDPAIRARVITALQDIACAAIDVIPEYPRMGTLLAASSAKGANICFLDAASNSEHAQVLIAELAAAMPVVALLARNDADLMLRCLRRGAREFLP